MLHWRWWRSVRARILPGPAEGEDLVDYAALPKMVPSVAVLSARTNNTVEGTYPFLPLRREDARPVRVF